MKLFTIDEANALLPAVRESLQKIQRCRRRLGAFRRQAKLAAENAELGGGGMEGGALYAIVLTNFTEEISTDTSVTFGNPAHDYPQSVSYARLGKNSLYARTDGNIGGKNRRIEFKYARRSCDRTD